MSNVKEQIQKWIDNGCDYEEGLSILTKHSNKRSLIKHLSRGNANASKAEHLKYHLLQLTDGISEEVITVNIEPVDLTEDLTKDKSGKPYPKDVVTLKKEKHKLYVKRATEHKKFVEIGTNNDDASKEKRKALKGTIEALTADIKVIDDKIVAILNGETPEQPKVSVINKIVGALFSKDAELPKPGEPLTADQVLGLKQAHSNLVSSISKAKANVDKTPDGPKKDGYKDKQAKLEEKRDRIKEILDAVK